MKPRLARPLLAALVGGALVAGGAVAASPAYAGVSPARIAATTADEPTDPPTTPVDPGTGGGDTGTGTGDTGGSTGGGDTGGSTGGGDTGGSTGGGDTGGSTGGGDTGGSTGGGDTGGSTGGGDTGGSTGGGDTGGSTGGGDTGGNTGGGTTDPGTTDPEPVPDTTAPTGTYRLSALSIWTGQQVVLYQNNADYADGDNDDSTIKRVVDWKDGTTSEFSSASATWLQHNYKSAGTYVVTETLTDAAGNETKLTATVYVKNAPTAISLSKKSVWNGERYNVTVKAVPAGTTSYVIFWGDGFYNEYKWYGKARTFPGYYYHYKGSNSVVTGYRPTQIAYRNANGLSTPVTGAWIKVKKDSWKPTVKVNKPSSPNRLKSWKYVTGTASDKGSGAPGVWVFLEKYSNGKDYCLNKNKKWQRVYDSTWDATCYSWWAPVTKGKWKFKVPAGLGKGYFWASAYAVDWADHRSKWKTVSAKITRS
ncbi:hypothetical protein [Actinoplanes octamycinicus]|uniref:hypothetical protein n=1 Tax=Actinoplanes octamycinicus TaxID=135948 RepID=UPI0035EC0D4D